MNDISNFVKLTQVLVTCLQGSGFRRTLIIGVLAKCFDIITDILR